MKVNNYKAYKVILLATLAKEEYPNYGAGKILPLRIWDMNSLDKGTIEKNIKFEKIRKENYASLPSRIKNNIFVFANKDYADKWIAQIYGKISDYLLLELSLDGEIKWFEATDYYEDKPVEYWTSASDNPLDSQTTEGLFRGVAKIENVVCRKFDIK